MGSVNPPIPALAVASLALLAAVVSGCATTQDANRRIDVRFSRTLASRQPLHFHGTDPNVRVVSTDVVDGKDSSAIVVVLRNTGDDPVNDDEGPRQAGLTALRLDPMGGPGTLPVLRDLPRVLAAMNEVSR